MNVAGAFAGIAAGFSSIMGGPYFDGVVRDQVDAVYDAGGSIVTPGGVVERSCMVQVDAATEAMRQAEGFTEKDVRLLIIDLTGAMNTDAAVEVRDGPRVGTFSVKACGPDPVGIGWECRARPV